MKNIVKYDSTEDTNDHKQIVYDLLVKVVEELGTRAVEHDLSKFGPVEKPIIDKRKEMKPAIAYHHSVNRHHPEHFKKYKCSQCSKRFNIEIITCPDCGSQLFTVEPQGVSGMNLVDVVEMICDISSLSIYRKDDIFERLKSHQNRFKYSDDLAWILRNTIEVLNA